MNLHIYFYNFYKNNTIYFTHYTQKPPQKNVLYRLKDKNYFISLACNDNWLVALNSNQILYQFLLSNETIRLVQTIDVSFFNLKKIWLDSESKKLLSNKGTLHCMKIFFLI